MDILNEALTDLEKENISEDEMMTVVDFADFIKNSSDPELFKNLAGFFDMYCTDKHIMEKLGYVISAAAMKSSKV